MVDGHLALAIGKVVCNIRGVEKIVSEIFFDDMLFIPSANDELIEAIMRIQLHDMPKNRLAAQFYHRLGFKLTLFANTGTVATC